MRTNETNAAPVTAAATVAAKPTKRAAKPNAKAAKPVAAPVADAAKPDTGADIAAERQAARDAIAAHYAGASLPFKAASDTFATFRTDKAPKRATERQAALLCAMLLCSDGNIQRNGNFTRGGFTFDAKRVQPETGCLSDMHGRVITHVSGPLSGKQSRDAIFNLNLAAARAEISANIGDKLAKPALAVIDKLLAA